MFFTSYAIQDEVSGINETALHLLQDRLSGETTPHGEFDPDASNTL